MTGSLLSFVCKDNPDPYNLSKTEIRLRAAEMGYVGESDDNLVHNFVNRTAADKYVAQYQIEVKEEWDRGVRRLDAEFAASGARAALATAQADDDAQDARPDEEPPKDEEQKAATTVEQDSGAAMLGLMKRAGDAASKKRAGGAAAARQKKKSKTTEMRRIDYSEPIVPTPTATQAGAPASSSASSSSAAPTAPGPKNDETTRAPKKVAANAGRAMMPDKTAGEIMAELNKCAAQGLHVTVSSLPPAIVKSVTVKPLTAAEEKEYDDAQAAAKAARAEKRRRR